MDEEKRRLKKAWAAEQKRNARLAFPLPDSQLESLFEFVDNAVEENGCDHTCTATRAWLKDAKVDPDPVLSWLAEHGGYCDCEVVANAGEHWEENRVG